MSNRYASHMSNRVDMAMPHYWDEKSLESVLPTVFNALPEYAWKPLTKLG